MKRIFADNLGNYYGVGKHPRRIGQPAVYGAFIKDPRGRVRPLALPGAGVRPTRQEAEADLERHAAAMGWWDTARLREAA